MNEARSQELARSEEQGRATDVPLSISPELSGESFLIRHSESSSLGCGELLKGPLTLRIEESTQCTPCGGSQVCGATIL